MIYRVNSGHRTFAGVLLSKYCFDLYLLILTEKYFFNFRHAKAAKNLYAFDVILSEA